MAALADTSEPHTPPHLPILALHFVRAALPLRKSPLPRFLRFARSPFTDLLLALLAPGSCDRGRGSKANAVDAFAVIVRARDIDVVARDLGILPGQSGRVDGVLAAAALRCRL